eukprot:GILI01001841.1.p1 GENE.GILI01001841.1~~GILI01001841.1.p1  ORF type:complete len:337 (+),score=91.04 GILI01001841.1:50-1060(+)
MASLRLVRFPFPISLSSSSSVRCLSVAPQVRFYSGSSPKNVVYCENANDFDDPAFPRYRLPRFQSVPNNTPADKIKYVPIEMEHDLEDMTKWADDAETFNISLDEKSPALARLSKEDFLKVREIFSPEGMTFSSSEMGNFKSLAIDPQWTFKKEGLRSVLLDISPVVKIETQGNLLRHRALVITGNRKGAVGFGIGKHKEPVAAVKMAMKEALEKLIVVDFDKMRGTYNRVIAHHNNIEVELIPSKNGIIKASPLAQSIAEAAGIPNITIKKSGRIHSVYSVVYAVFKALSQIRSDDTLGRALGLKISRDLIRKKDGVYRGPIPEETNTFTPGVPR